MKSTTHVSFWAFEYWEFKTLDPKTLVTTILNPRTPKHRNAETHLHGYFTFHKFRIYDVKCLESLSTGMPKPDPQNAEMPLQGFFGFCNSGFFNTKAPGSLSSGLPVFQILNYRNLKFTSSSIATHDFWISTLLGSNPCHQDPRNAELRNFQTAKNSAPRL
jgi:hypothetical protein